MSFAKYKGSSAYGCREENRAKKNAENNLIYQTSDDEELEKTQHILTQTVQTMECLQASTNSENEEIHRLEAQISQLKQKMMELQDCLVNKKKTEIVGKPSNNTVEEDVKKFNCLEIVSDASEEEIENALCSNNWEVATAIKVLKVQQLAKCHKTEWKFVLKKSETVCKMVLESLNWDLEKARKRVRGVKMSLPSVPQEELPASVPTTASTRVPAVNQIVR